MDEFRQSPQYLKGSVAERVLLDDALPNKYGIPIQFRAPQESHPFDFIFNIGNTIFAGECKCTSLLEKYDAYAIKRSQHVKYAHIEKTRPGLFVLFFVDPYIGKIFAAKMSALMGAYDTICTTKGDMIAYPVKNMYVLDYEIDKDTCEEMLSYDSEMKAYEYSLTTEPEHMGVLSRDVGFITQLT